MTSVAVIYVAYGVTSIDLAWIPQDVAVIVVHNDDRLPEARCQHRGLVHLHPSRNLGFGAAVNEAMWSVDAERVILCNPDTALERAHFMALTQVGVDEIVTVPLVEENGAPNAVVSPYWGVAGFVATALRLGRFAPRGGRLRATATRLLGGWGAGHRDALGHRRGVWSVRDRWATGAVLSLPVEAFRAVGGFDEEYFLYFEDADLHQRLGQAFPEMTVCLADVSAALHRVGGSVRHIADAEAVVRHRRASAVTYASRQDGFRWQMAAAVVARAAR